MNKRIAIQDLPRLDTMQRDAQLKVCGRGVSNGYLFSSRPRSPQAPVLNQFVNIDNYEVNNYRTVNHIDKMIHQTVNQNQLNMVSVNAGDGGVAVNVDQGMAGANSNS